MGVRSRWCCIHHHHDTETVSQFCIIVHINRNSVMVLYHCTHQQKRHQGLDRHARQQACDYVWWYKPYSVDGNENSMPVALYDDTNLEAVSVDVYNDTKPWHCFCWCVRWYKIVTQFLLMWQRTMQKLEWCRCYNVTAVTVRVTLQTSTSSCPRKWARKTSRFVFSLTPSLPWCHLKNSQEKCKILKPCCFIFCTGMWKDFDWNAYRWK